MGALLSPTAAETTLRAIRDLIPMDYLKAHDMPGATGPTGSLDLVGAMRAYSAARWRLIGRVKRAEADREVLLTAMQALVARTKGDNDTPIGALWADAEAAIAQAVQP